MRLIDAEKLIEDICRIMHNVEERREIYANPESILYGLDKAIQAVYSAKRYGIEENKTDEE